MAVLVVEKLLSAELLPTIHINKAWNQVLYTCLLLHIIFHMKMQLEITRFCEVIFTWAFLYSLVMWYFFNQLHRRRLCLTFLLCTLSYFDQWMDLAFQQLMIVFKGGLIEVYFRSATHIFCSVKHSIKLFIWAQDVHAIFRPATHMNPMECFLYLT